MANSGSKHAAEVEAGKSEIAELGKRLAEAEERAGTGEKEVSRLMPAVEEWQGRAAARDGIVARLEDERLRHEKALEAMLAGMGKLEEDMAAMAGQWESEMSGRDEIII